MIGGLFKSASRLALVAVAGVMVGGVSAQAADLGGDCCADLEERVAELEATTVRKGNRKVSLTVSGWVHKSIMHWDDGIEKNTYAGVDNINAATRFRFTGDAKITPKWSTGYLIEIEAFGDSNSSQMNQLSNRGDIAGTAGAAGTTTNVRHSAWWLDNKDYGRVWVGLTDPAGTGIDGINLANTNFAANVKVGLNGGGMLLRGNTDLVGTPGVPNMSARTWTSILMGNNGLMSLSDETRHNVVKYVSPTMMGFIFSAAWGEDDMWDVALRYAGEFSGFKLAAGAAYTQVTDASPGAAAQNQHFTGCADAAAFGVAAGNNDRDCSSWVVAGSVMHVATGLFLTGNYGERTDNNRKAMFANTAASANIDTALISSTDTNWSVRGGIEKNWTGMGKTTLFGEYNVFSGTPLVAGNATATDAALLGGAAQALVSSSVSVWGMGVVQSFDAAALDLYLAYRNFSADVKSAPNVIGGGTNDLAVRDFQMITFGAVMRF
jgi:hypothetical protein